MKQSRPAPTLQDVAAYAGVSTATVSRCMNAPAKVTAKTRTRVEDAIETLGYAPNFGARAMAAQRTMTIGAVIPTMENAVFAKGLQAFQDELRQYGFTMLVACSSYRPELEAEQIRALVGRGADGILLIGHERDPAIYRFLDAQKVPTLVTWAFDDTAPRPSVGFDNRQAMAKLAQHVIKLDHRHVAMITAPVATNDRAAARFAAVGDVMDAEGLVRADLFVVETPYSIDNGAAALDLILQQRPETTVVICGNDVLAVGALRQARGMGLSVPDDLSITGFDDIDLAVVTHPLLTTVHVPHRQMGRAAAQMLADMVLTGAPATKVKLATTVKLRDTLGYPRQSPAARQRDQLDYP
ncbi:LacI family DNA-binding transcriptional regulator [Yoonia sp.]|uniref:LacI family DNA-binding transcriptional regulator n=1 Tax=Yoonia sp. TaxID=2212373 RepID=UPI003A4D2D0C